MNLKSIYGIIMVFLLIGCSEPVTIDNPKGPFFGIELENHPKLLAPRLLASPAEEYNGTFSPDGKEFYYTTDIPENAYVTFTQMIDDSTWSEPKVASFSGQYPDYDPIFSPDGSRLFFSSRRPPFTKNSKIWFVERTADGWSEPTQVAISGAGKNLFYNSVTNRGDIYFNSSGDIFKAQKNDTVYEAEGSLPVLKGDYDKVDPFISPNEDYLIFRGYRDDSLGRGDLYISFQIDRNWTVPENLGQPINSTANEMCPYVTPDGKIFIFASSRINSKLKTKPMDPITKVQKKYNSIDNGELNIYYMSTDFIKKMKKNIRTVESGG